MAISNAASWALVSPLHIENDSIPDFGDFLNVSLALDFNLSWRNLMFEMEETFLPVVNIIRTNASSSLSATGFSGGDLAEMHTLQVAHNHSNIVISTQLSVGDSNEHNRMKMTYVVATDHYVAWADMETAESIVLVGGIATIGIDTIIPTTNALYLQIWSLWHCILRSMGNFCGSTKTTNHTDGRLLGP